MKRRIFAMILTIVLFVNISSPIIHAVDSPSTTPGTILSSGNYTLYCFENQEYKFNIFLDTISGIGSFAVIYSSSPNHMQEYSFSLTPEDIHVASMTFWDELVSCCFSNVSSWNSVNLENAISTSIQPQSESTRAVSYDYQGLYEGFLAEEYGPEREDYYTKTNVVGGIPFSQYENVFYGVSKSNSFIIGTTMTVAGVITSVIGLVVSPGLLSVIGLVASVSGIVVAGTQLDEYILYAYWAKYIVRHEGTIKYSFVEQHANYYGYGSNKLPISDELTLDLLDSDIICVPTDELFENDYAQFAAAYENYSG